MGEALKKKLAPDVTIDGVAQTIGVVHRHTEGGEVYFLANTSNEPQSVKATFRVEGMQAELWDPLTGKISALPVTGAGTVALDLRRMDRALVVWTKRALPAAEPWDQGISIDLSTGWEVTFRDGMVMGQLGGGARGKTVSMDKLTSSWIDVPGLKNYSGVATYTRKFTLAGGMAKAPLVITLWEIGRQQAAGERKRAGKRICCAACDPPVRDVAVVYLNDKRVGTAWCPPYQVDVSGALKEGEKYDSD